MCLACVLKLISLQGINIYYLYISEILPTSIRSTGIGVIETGGFAFLSLSPYIVYVSTLFEFQQEKTTFWNTASNPLEILT